MPGVTISLFVVAFLFVTLAIAIFIFCSVRRRFLVSKAVLVIFCFIASLVAWIGIENGFGGMKDFGSDVGKAIRMFAFSLSSEDYPAGAESVGGIKICLITLEVVDFAAISYVILTTVIRSLISWCANLFRSQKGRSCLRHKHYIFTDLPYAQLKDALHYLTKQRKEPVVVVLKQDSLSTQEGSELRGTLLAEHYQVIGGTLSAAFISHCVAFQHLPIRFHAEFRNDLDNIEFAKEALLYCQRKQAGLLKLGKEPEPADAATKAAYAKKKSQAEKPIIKCPVFYIAHENPDFQELYNFEQDSYGHIRFHNEYEWSATQFVYNNPITRMMDFPFADETKVEHDLPHQRFAIHFLGYGRISEALLKAMIPVYQFPSDEPIIQYLALDEKFGEDEAKNRPYFPALPGLDHAGDPAYLPQWKGIALKSCPIDVEKKGELEHYAEELFRQVYASDENAWSEAEKNRYGDKAGQAIVIIALGGSERNIEVATALRSLLRQKMIIAGINKGVLQGYYKKIVLYPYIKERDLFYPDYADFAWCFERKKKDIAAGKASNAKLLDLLYNKDEMDEHIDKAEIRRLYVFMPWTDYWALPPLKHSHFPQGKQDWAKLREECFYQMRDEDYKNEALPIVVFGRRGFVVDQVEEKEHTLAEECSALYGLKEKLSSNEAKEETEVSFYDEKSQQQIFKPFFLSGQSHDSSVGDWAMNTSLALSLPEKLAYWGLRLKDVPPEYAVVSSCAKRRQELYSRYSKESEKTMAEVKRVEESIEGIQRTVKPEDVKILEAYFGETFPSAYEAYARALAKPVAALSPQEKGWALALAACEEAKKAYLVWQKDSTKINDFARAVERYYALNYTLLIPLKERHLQQMEHNRWYAHSLLRGCLPPRLECFNLNAIPGEKYPNAQSKTKQWNLHWCCTTNKGLDRLGEIQRKNLAYCIEDLFHEEASSLAEGVHPVKSRYRVFFEKVEVTYVLTFWYDTFSLANLGSLVMSNGAYQGKGLEPKLFYFVKPRTENN